MSQEQLEGSVEVGKTEGSATSVIEGSRGQLHTLDTDPSELLEPGDEITEETPAPNFDEEPA